MVRRGTPIRSPAGEPNVTGGARRTNRLWVSRGSGAAMTAATRAASATERASGPGESWLVTSGTTPLRLTTPTDGL